MRLAYLLCTVFLGTLAFSTLACGNSSSQRELQKVNVSPTSADAQNYPNGQVQFTAAGTYNTSPVTVTPLQASWGVALNGLPSTGVSIKSDGVAQCADGAAPGVYSIGAWDVMHTNGATCAIVGPYGEPGCNAVLGTAQLTCP
jgi:hypothetical protein